MLAFFAVNIGSAAALAIYVRAQERAQAAVPEALVVATT